MSGGKRDLETIASEYDSMTDFDRYAIEHEVDTFLAGYRGGRVLELGCAKGGMTRKMAGVVDELVVVDGSRTYLDPIAEELKGKGEFVCSLFEAYQPAKKFRHVLAARILEHLDEPVPFLRHVAGWLEPEGLLHVIVPNARSFHRLLGVEMGMIADIHELGPRDHKVGHVRVYDSDTLTADLEAAGLDVVTKESVLMKPLSNAQMEAFSPEIVAALFKMTKHFPDHGNELYFRCRRR